MKDAKSQRCTTQNTRPILIFLLEEKSKYAYPESCNHICISVLCLAVILNVTSDDKKEKRKKGWGGGGGERLPLETPALESIYGGQIII